MKKSILLIISLVGLQLSIFAQSNNSETKINDSLNNEIEIFSQDSIESDLILFKLEAISDSISNLGISIKSKSVEQEIENIKSDLKIIKENTEPDTFFEKLFDNIVLNQIYDFFFSDSESTWISFLISLIGIAISIIRLIIVWKKPGGKFGKLSLSIFVLILSSLLLLLSNSRVNTEKSFNTSVIEERLRSIERDLNEINTNEFLLEIQSLKLAISSNPKLTEGQNSNQVNLNKISVMLNTLEGNLTERNAQIERNISEEIKDVNTHGFLLKLILVLAISILGLIIYLNWDRLIQKY